LELIKRSEIPGALRLFGLEFGDSWADAALRLTRVKAAGYEGIVGGKGRVALFDPMAVWVLVSIWESNKRKFADLPKDMDYFRGVYQQLRKRPDAAGVPGFLEDEEFGAQVLMLTSPLSGMEPRDIRRLALNEGRVLDLSARGREHLVTVLQAYKGVLGLAITGEPLPAYGAGVGTGAVTLPARCRRACERQCSVASNRV